MKERIYICHTFYHVYIAVLKELNLDKSKRGQASLILSTMSNDFSEMVDRARKCDLFEAVYLYDEKADVTSDKVMKYHKDRGNLVSNLLQRIIYTKLLGKLQEQYIPVNLKEYKDIYVFCDSDPIGYYLSYRRIPYHAVEDGLDTIKYCDDAKYGNRGHFELKARMAALNLIFIENGYSKYCIDMEVNEISGIKYPTEKFIEVPRRKLFEGVNPEDVHYFTEIFMPNGDELMRKIDSANKSKRQMLVLSDPVCDPSERGRIMRDIINEYCKDATVFIKPHPRDIYNYETEEFDDCIILSGRYPMEVLNLYPQLHIDTVISILTVIDGIDFADNKIFLGPDFMDRYEDPLIHRQNEQI